MLSPFVTFTCLFKWLYPVHIQYPASSHVTFHDVTVTVPEPLSEINVLFSASICMLYLGAGFPRIVQEMSNVWFSVTVFGVTSNLVISAGSEDRGKQTCNKRKLKT